MVTRVFFGCLVVALCWFGRDGVRAKDHQKSQPVQAAIPNEAKI